MNPDEPLPAPQAPVDQGQYQTIPPPPQVYAPPAGPYQPQAAQGPTPAAPPQPVYAPQDGGGYSQAPSSPNYAPAQSQPQYGQAPGQPGPYVGNVPAAAPMQPRTNPNSTQNALQIAEIRDGIVIMSDGSFRSVIMLKSINFDLMSPQEREAVEFSYQGFLNSLYFPVQIFIRSQKVDLGPYIDKLDKIRSEHDNMLLALLMDDYINFMANLAQQTNIMDKKFYMIIPYYPVVVDAKQAIQASKNYFTNFRNRIFGEKEQHVTINENDLETAKTELRNRVQSVLSGFMQCGVQGLPLDTQELIELYYDAYNPDTATRQQLKNFSDLNAPVVTKGQGAAPQPNLDKELGL